jgi:RNA polymerase sigma-54 factor
VNSLDLRTEHRQTQTLSPRLQHAVRLLQMSSLDFAAMLRDTLGKNPFLEVDDIDGAEGMEGAEGAQPLTTLHDGATVSSQLEAAPDRSPAKAATTATATATSGPRTAAPACAAPRTVSSAHWT